MGGDVLVLAEPAAGALAEVTFELVGKARELAAAWGGRVEVAVLGDAGEVEALPADLVLAVDHPALASYTSEAYERALLHLLRERAPRLLLLANTTVGLDLGAAVAAAWGAPLVAYAVDLRAEGSLLVATAQLYGGKLLAEAELSGERAVCTVVAGSFPAEAGRGGGPGAVERVEPPADLDDVRTTVVATLEPEAGDVDITAAEVLVAVGRGIGGPEALEEVQELADALGAAVAASRPVTDAGWLPRSRQVGKSGLKVRPRAYLALGISGAPEHLEGMRDAELIVACNTDPRAPIFDVAHYGTTVDLFDLVPALTEQLRR